MQHKKLSMDELQRKSVEEFKTSKKNNIAVLLDDIRSMSNVGGVFLSSDAFNGENIYLGVITSSPPHREIEKTALGATESVDWEYHENAVELLNNLVKDGWIPLVIEQVENSIKLNDFKPEPNKKYLIILGNEVFGVNQELIGLSDIVLEIPQFGTKHSLNIAVTAGIVLWDLTQKTLSLS